MRVCENLYSINGAVVKRGETEEFLECGSRLVYVLAIGGFLNNIAPLGPVPGYTIGVPTALRHPRWGLGNGFIIGVILDPGTGVPGLLDRRAYGTILRSRPCRRSSAADHFVLCVTNSPPFCP